MATYKYLDDNNPDGTILGQSAAALVGFWGKAPIAQPAATAQSNVATTTITNVGSTSLTALDLTVLNSLIARVEAIRVQSQANRDALVNTGLAKGSI